MICNKTKEKPLVLELNRFITHFISFLSLVHTTLSCFKRKMSLSPDMYYSIALQNLLNKGKNRELQERQTKDYIQQKVSAPVSDNQSIKTEVKQEPVKQPEVKIDQPTEVKQPTEHQEEVPTITLDEQVVQQENFKHYPYYYQPPEESYSKYTSVIIVVVIIVMLFFMYYQYAVNKKIMKKYKKLHSIVKALNK